MFIYKITDPDLRISIMRGEEFMTGGKFRGAINIPNKDVDVPFLGHPWGQLDSTYWESVAGSSYIVWSYGTPIAWYKDMGNVKRDGGNGHSGYWVMPNHYYSTTTRRHQNIVRRALVLADVREPESEYDDR